MTDGEVFARVQTFIRGEEGAAADIEDLVKRLKREFPSATREELEESIIEAAGRSGVAVFWRGDAHRKEVSS